MKGLKRSSAFTRSASALAVSIFFVSSTAAMAQDAAAAETDEIVVTGVRAALEASMEIKRDSDGVVDAISAEDIGKFPDTNLAESLQRIPGVSISRVNGEGSQVTVRGFGPSFNLVTVNGRQLATSNVDAVGGDQGVDFSRSTSRSFDFSNLASEGVSRLEVYKTGRASNPSGGIGATINVVTLRPLDTNGEGLRGSIGAKLLYDTSLDIKDVTPELSGVVGWSDPEGVLGVSLFGSYQKRESSAASATSNDWNIARFSAMPGRGANTVITNGPTDPNQLVAVPNDSRYHYSRNSRERINGQATLQFRPVESFTLTADAMYAQNTIDEERMDQTNWFNRPFDAVTFDGNPVVATPILISEGTGFGVKDIGFEQQYRSTKSTLKSFGLNLEMGLIDDVTLTLDANTSKSKTNPNGRNGASSTLVAFGAPVVDAHSVDYSGPIPLQDWTLNDSVRGNNNGVLDIGDLGTQVQRTNASSQEHSVNQLSADLAWDFGDGDRLRVGATYIDSNMTSARIQTQQTLGDWGITRVGDVQQLAGGLIEQFCLQCEFSTYSPTSADIAFRGNAVDLYEAFADAYTALGNPINISGNDFDQVEEKVWAGYAQLNLAGDVLGRPAKFSAGIRYENTKVRSTSLIIQPDRIEWDSDNDFTRVIGTVEAPLDLKGEYNNFLPSVDFQIEPLDNVVTRVSYSRTIARPDYGNLFASQSANIPNRPTFLGGVAQGTSGNPNLKPLQSDNFDISFEWYFDQSSYVSAGFFAKNVKNFVGQGQVESTLFNLRDPSSGAAGSRSGTALAELNRLNVGVTDVSLFTMTALLVETGNITTASQQFMANFNTTTGQLNQAFADSVLGRVDVIADANDPLFQFAVATPINNRSAKIHGFEIQGQYFLGNTGFGVSGSLTKVYGDVDVDIGADPSANQFALVGLSDSFNVTGIYEGGGLSARVAYNWRGKFLAATNRGSSRNPVFFEPFGTVDVSLGYDLTEDLTFSLEAINVLSEPVRSYGRDVTNLWFAQEQKPRVLVGARYKF